MKVQTPKNFFFPVKFSSIKTVTSISLSNVHNFYNKLMYFTTLNFKINKKSCWSEKKSFIIQRVFHSRSSISSSKSILPDFHSIFNNIQFDFMYLCGALWTSDSEELKLKIGINNEREVDFVINSNLIKKNYCNEVIFYRFEIQVEFKCN